MLTLGSLLKRLKNEERELLRNKYKITKYIYYNKKREFTEVEVPTVYGLEAIPVVVRYRINIWALGYELDPSNRVRQRWNHTFDLYIMRNYPLPYTSRRLGAPIRIVWVTPIFHPNIAPGEDYGGTGVVCWNVFKKWLPAMNLLSIVRGVENLVANPDPGDPIHNPPICLKAAEYFKNNPPPKVVRKHKER